MAQYRNRGPQVAFGTTGSYVFRDGKQSNAKYKACWSAALGPFVYLSGWSAGLMEGRLKLLVTR